MAEPVLNVASSFAGRRWVWRQGEDRIGFAIAQRHGLPEVMGRLLAARGIDVETTAHFLEPTLRALLPDPAIMADMNHAAARLADAARRGETVAVFGDYDVDGACSSAILVILLRQLGCHVTAYVPDRLAEGYGPNAPALLRLAQGGATLIVCADCGTAAAEALRAVHGMAEVVVLDHHACEGAPPPVLATVNPSRLDCRSGLHGLCAAGVVFLTAIATIRELRRGGFFAMRPEPDLLGLLDLVALATVCDVMPLTGVNRALVTQGLKIMARRARPGVAALLEVALAHGLPTAATCGFALGPRINAAGRISESDLGLRLLLTDDAVEARALAARLDAVNQQRQDVEAGIMEDAIAAAAAQAADGHPTLVISGRDWHPGVVGIIAGRLKERHNRPVCVGGELGGLVKGSGRSVPGIDLGTAIIAARQAGILTSGGGHKMAAGFALPAARLPDFHAFLDSKLHAAATLPGAADLLIEATLAVPAATTELAQHVQRLAPFGNANEEPVFAIPRARVVRADRIGREGATIRAIIEGEGGGARLKALLFRGRDGALAQALLGSRTPMHLAGHLRAEEWSGNTSQSLILQDAAPA